MLSGYAGSDGAVIPVHSLSHHLSYFPRHHVTQELPLSSSSPHPWTHTFIDATGIKLATTTGRHTTVFPDYPPILMSGIEQQQSGSEVTGSAVGSGVNSCSSSSSMSSSFQGSMTVAGASSHPQTHVNGHFSQHNNNNHQYHSHHPNQSKDTTYTKIFVGGLPYHTTDKSLRKFFETFGEIEEAVVITDRQTGKSRGYGFVTMADREAAERAVKDANPIIDGRKANVNLAYLGAKPRSNTTWNGLPFQTRSGPYHPILPGGHLGIHPNPFMYHHTPPSNTFVGPSLLLPPTTHFLDFSASFPAPPPPAPATAAAAASFLNHHSAFNPFHGGAGHGPSSIGVMATAGGPHAPFTGTFIPDGRMQ